MPMKRRLSTNAALIFSTLAAAGGMSWLAANGVGWPTAVAVSLCGAIILAGMLVLGSETRIEQLQKALIARPARILIVIATLWSVYFVYSMATGTAQLQGLLVLAIYLSLPFLLLSHERTESSWLDMIAILWIWLPLEFGILRHFLITSSARGTDFHYGFAQGLAINMGLVAFLAWSRFPGVGYRFEVDRRILVAGVSSFVLFAAIAIPLGFAIGFITYSFEWKKLFVAPATFLGIFLFIAIPEELLFRGLLQNWIERATSRHILSLILASIVFGAAHLNNGAPIPNYRYFLMAAIAGLFYGGVWQRTRSLVAAGITHALVDTAWTVFFRG